MSDREPFEQARAAGKAKHQDQRVTRLQIIDALKRADGFRVGMPHAVHGFDAGCPVCQGSPSGIADVLFTAALLPTEAETKALAETATKLGYELGRKEALEDQLAQVEDAAHRWEVQQERWDVGTPEQRGRPHQVAMAWERKGELRCWAKHLRHADELLDAPDITKGTS